MSIRPIDVRRKEFNSGFRGYDATQVDDFLDEIADEFERTYTENARLREEISGLRERLQQFEDLEGSIRSALVHAEQAANDLRRTASREAEDLRKSAGREAEDLRKSAGREAEDLRKSASREAELTIREAKARSHQMLAESSARVEHIQESYEALQEARRSFMNDFRQLLKSYADVMDSMEVASAKEIEASLRERLDTESIAVAHEAATHEEEVVEPTAPPIPEDAEQEPEAAELEEELAAEETAVTQRMEPETAGEAPPTEPEVEEPEVGEPEAEEVEAEEPEAEEVEVEPPTAPRDPDVRAEAEEATAVAEPAPVEEPAEEVEREEPSLAGESSSESFFDREERSPEEGGQDSRIFRASRFLRRRE
jgi:cell division initiation protein